MDEKWATEKYAKSGEVVKWLLGACPGGLNEIRSAIRYSERWQRRWQEWQADPNIRVDVETTLDSFLCVVGMPLSMAPDHIFGDPHAKKYRQGKKGASKKTRAEAVRFAAENGTTAAAKKYGVTPAAVRHWIRAYKKERGESTARASRPAVDAAAKMRLANPKMTYAEISRQTGVPRTTIRRRVAKMSESGKGVS
jgi:transposase-like protein